MKAIKQTYTRAEMERAVEEARRKGNAEVCQMVLRIVALALFDKAGLSKEKVAECIDQIEVYCNAFVEGEVTFDDFQNTLKDEYDFWMVG